MSKEVKDFVDKLSNLDNEHMQTLIEKFTNVINKRYLLIEKTLKNKDINKFNELIPLFKNCRGSDKFHEILSNLTYKKEDFNFFKTVYSKLDFIGVKKTVILNNFLQQSLKDNDFFNLVKEDFKDPLRLLIAKNFTRNKLTEVEPKLFIQLMDFSGLTIKLDNFSTYLKDKNFPILKEIFESGRFNKFLNLKYEKIIQMTLNDFQKEAAEYLITKYAKDKKATLVLSNDQQSENFCSSTNTNFYYYILDNFEFDNTSLMYLTHHLAKVKNLDKWKNSVQILVQKIDDLDLLEQLKRKINISKNEEFKEVAGKEFNFCYLNKTLDIKQPIKQMKI